MTERNDDGPVRQPKALTNPAALEHIAAMVGEIDANKVAAVIAAYHAIQEGDPLGTVRRDPETGAVALRVEDGGFHLWRVNLPNGEFYNDTQPTLPWPPIG
jgi:hypothetical protein